MILLTTMVVENLEQAKQTIWYYKQRWACEGASRFLKSRFGLERFRIRRYEAIQRLVILAMFAMGFLTWILLRNRQSTGRIISYTRRFRKKTKLVYYRLLEGLQEFTRLKQLRLGEILLEPLKTGNRVSSKIANSTATYPPRVFLFDGCYCLSYYYYSAIKAQEFEYT